MNSRLRLDCRRPFESSKYGNFSLAKCSPNNFSIGRLFQDQHLKGQRPIFSFFERTLIQAIEARPSHEHHSQILYNLAPWALRLYVFEASGNFHRETTRLLGKLSHLSLTTISAPQENEALTIKCPRLSIYALQAGYSGSSGRNLGEYIPLQRQCCPPRSAPLIGSKLSGRATLIRFIIWAFQDTWEQSFGDPEKFAALDKNRVSGNWQLQSTILCLPWITAEFILQAQQTWVEKYARDQHYRHYLPQLDDDGDPFIYGHGHDFEGGVGHFNSQQCFEADYQEVLSWKPFERVGSWGGCDIHPKVRIPTSLITGPWDEKNLRLLFWLRRGGLVYGLEEHDRSWEIQLDCLRNAFIDAPEPNAFITNLIDLTALCQGLPRDVAREQRRRIDQRLKWGADSVISKEILRQVYGTIGIFHDGFGTSSSPK